MKLDHVRKYTPRVMLFFIISMFAFVFWLSITSKEPMRGAVQPHFMLYGTIYWPGHPSYGSFYEKGFDDVRFIIEESPEPYTLTEDFQAYEIPVGTKVYLHPKIPHQAYVDSPIGPLPYASTKAKRDYLFHDDQIYVSLRSAEREAYRNWAVRDAFLSVLPETAHLLGDSHFVGYNNFSNEELGTNWADGAWPVYQDQDNPSVLYLELQGVDFLVFVPYKG